MVIKMSARMHEVINIVRTYEIEYRKKHDISPLVPLKDFIYKDAPQEVIDAYEEMRSEKLSDWKYQ